MADNERHDDTANRAERADKAARPETFAPAGVKPGRPSELANAQNPVPEKK